MRRVFLVIFLSYITLSTTAQIAVVLEKDILTTREKEKKTPRKLDKESIEKTVRRRDKTKFPMIMVGQPIYSSNKSGNSRSSANEYPARYPGGNNALMDYFIQHIDYPRNQLKQEENQLILIIKLDNRGKVKHCEVQYYKDPKVEKAILRATTNLSRFYPAKYNGRRVASSIELPITMRLLK